MLHKGWRLFLPKIQDCPMAHVHRDRAAAMLRTAVHFAIEKGAAGASCARAGGRFYFKSRIETGGSAGPAFRFPSSQKPNWFTVLCLTRSEPLCL